MTTQKRTIVYTPESKTATGGTTSQQETVETGVNQTAVPTASPGVNKRVDVSVSMNDHGSMTTQKRTTTFVPSERRLSWSDASNRYQLVVYRNSPSPKAPPGSEGSASASFSINDHGSYDGTALRKTDRQDMALKTLAYSHGPVDVSATIYYLKKGHMWTRSITAELEVFYGPLASVMKKVAKGENCTMAGFVSGYAVSGISMAHGRKYTNIDIGPEIEIVD